MASRIQKHLIHVTYSTILSRHTCPTLNLNRKRNLALLSRPVPSSANQWKIINLTRPNTSKLSSRANKVFSRSKPCEFLENWVFPAISFLLIYFRTLREAKAPNFLQKEYNLRRIRWKIMPRMKHNQRLNCG